MLVSGGCHHTVNRYVDCNRIDLRHATTIATINSSGAPGEIHVGFDHLAQTTTSPTSGLGVLLAGQPVDVGLEQCACVAAMNSPLAALIDKERKAICCKVGYVQCVDQFLAGQALEQRNKAAADAGELFLRLVDVRLQRKFVDKSFAKLAGFEYTIELTRESGWATAEAEDELNARKIELKKKKNEIDSAELKLVAKLSSILGIDRSQPVSFELNFDVDPRAEDIGLEQAIAKALLDRPELAAMPRMDCCGVNSDCFSLLSQLDPRLGIDLGSPKPKFRWLALRQPSDPSCTTRISQWKNFRAGREEMIRQEVVDAVIDIQRYYQELLLENEDLSRLEERLVSIESSAVLGAQAAYLASVKNWGQQQETRSRRVAAAIQYEIAKVQLLAAQGQWAVRCGLSLPQICRNDGNTSLLPCGCRAGN